MCVTARETDRTKAAQWSVGAMLSNTHTDRHIAAGYCKVPQTCMFICSEFPWKSARSCLLSIHTENEVAWWDFTEPHQDLIRLFFSLHSSRIKQRNGRRALLALRDFYLFLFLVLASRLAGFCRIMDIPFLCLFSLEIFTHTKETKWNASPLSQPTFFAPVVPYGLSLLERVGFFFSPQYPKEHVVIKTINAAFLKLFIGCKLW